MTVVLVGAKLLPEIELLADAIEDRGGDSLIVDVTDWPGEPPLTYAPDNGDAVLKTPFDVDDVEGAYVHVHAMFHENDVTIRDEFKQREDIRPVLNQWREHRSLFESLCREFESRETDVLPRLRHHYLQQRKPWQLSRFEASGLPVPDTVFTNDPDEVEAFCETHDRVVYKPVANGAPPSEVTDEDLSDERLENLSTAPVQFQEFVEGDDLRVYVLDGEVVGAIRYESQHFSFKLDMVEDEEVGVVAATLSEEIENTAIRAADAVDLTYGAADIRRRPDGDHAILELNEAPVYAAADAEADQRVAEALADYLTDA